MGGDKEEKCMKGVSDFDSYVVGLSVDNFYNSFRQQCSRLLKTKTHKSGISARSMNI